MPDDVQVTIYFILSTLSAIPYSLRNCTSLLNIGEKRDQRNDVHLEKFGDSTQNFDLLIIETVEEVV